MSATGAPAERLTIGPRVRAWAVRVWAARVRVSAVRVWAVRVRASAVRVWAVRVRAWAVRALLVKVQAAPGRVAWGGSVASGSGPSRCGPSTA